MRRRGHRSTQVSMTSEEHSEYTAWLESKMTPEEIEEAQFRKRVRAAVFGLGGCDTIANRIVQMAKMEIEADRKHKGFFR